MLRVQFDHVDGGLVVKGEKPAAFAIAGDDRRWYWAHARVAGDTVVVSSPSVPDPKAVRYAWQAKSGGDPVQWRRSAGSPVSHR